MIDFQHQMLCDYYNLQPSSVRGRGNINCEYQKRYLWNKLYSKYDFTLPEGWPIGYFRFWLFVYGSISVIYTRKNGWIMTPYSITKLGMYYQPTMIEAYNQFMASPVRGIVGVNAGIVHIMDDWYGLDDLITDYAETLAQIDKTVKTNLMRCSVGDLCLVDNKKTADEIKEAYSRSTTGEPLVVVDSDVLKNGKFVQDFTGNVQNKYIVDKLITARRSIVNQYLTDIGIGNTNYDKRERLTTVEVTENNEETESLVHVIYNNIRKCFEQINAISGLGLAVRLREEVETDGTFDNLGDGAI